MQMKMLAEFFGRMAECLESGPLLVWYLDGLGYRMYEQARRAGYMSQIDACFQVSPVSSVYPPLTNPALATMLTGLQPEEHGVCDRSVRRLDKPTIFEQVTSSFAWLEGDSVIIKTQSRPKLHTDRDGQGCDEWICKSAQQELDKGTRFIFAHLHQIDDCGHTYGPYARQTLRQMEKTDRMISEISAAFPGKVLLISDHGMHVQEGKGSHGMDCEEDMLAIWGEYR